MNESLDCSDMDQATDSYISRIANQDKEIKELKHAAESNVADLCDLMNQINALNEEFKKVYAENKELKQAVQKSQADSRHVRDGIQKAKDKIKEYAATQCGNEAWDILHDTEITTKGAIKEGGDDGGN